VLDMAAVERVRQEALPDPRDADELHDALMTCGLLTMDELAGFDPAWLRALVETGRATVVEPPATAIQGAAVRLAIAVERLPEWRALHPSAVDPAVAIPAARAAHVWAPAAAAIELVRSRLTITGPVTTDALARTIGVPSSDLDESLLALEAEGVVLRGRFTPGAAAGTVEWCDRALLARIHRYTLNRLRAEIEPVTPADFMRFLFTWQYVEDSARLTGPDGLRQVLERLDGFEAPAAAWERALLPSRMDRYEPSMLDVLCLSGEVGWARLSSPGMLKTASVTPIALLTGDHGDAWQQRREDGEAADAGITDDARVVRDLLRARGASFFKDLMAALPFDADRMRQALSVLVAAGLVTSDGFAGLRMLVAASQGRVLPDDRRASLAGRWSVRAENRAPMSRDAAIEQQAWTLLRRYGVVFRRLLIRETTAAPWRDLTRVCRRLEARGEIRGGRFVSGMAGEQFALPDAVPVLREVRRTPASGTIYSISTADPLNLSGIVTAGARLRAASRNRVAYRNGVPVAALENQVFRALVPLDAAETAAASSALSSKRTVRPHLGAAGLARI